MTTPTIADYLKFANLQMAAEALYDFNAVKAGKPGGTPLVPGASQSAQSIDVPWLTEGNLHASKFTQTIAEDFIATWEIVEHQSNTATGFSGTLFKAKVARPDLGIAKDELVLSFRSTEFIDDAARDNEATNKLEIKEKGWAFGQLSDMETWYQELLQKAGADGQPMLAGQSFSVTGYSLGGHLATAFNLMHGYDTFGEGGPRAIKQVITFNGAGVGLIGDGSLEQTRRLQTMVERFTELRTLSDFSGFLATDEAKALYQNLKEQIAVSGNPNLPSLAGIKWNKAQLDELIAMGGEQAAYAAIQRDDYGLLIEALERAGAVYSEAHRAPDLSSGGTPESNPARIPDASIAAESLDYQLAVIVTAREFNTSALPLLDGAAAITGPKNYGSVLTGANQFDVVATEMDNTTPYDMVANSQYHYGLDVPLYIEDQPQVRGNATLNMLYDSALNFGVKLLGNNYERNDFGDTHSLVLLVDSLSVMDLFSRIDPTLADKPSEIAKLFQAATASKAAAKPGGNGKAEGDTLEAVVNALGKLFLGDSYTALDLAGLNQGNTWWDPAKRELLHQRIAAIQQSQLFQQSAGRVTVQGLTPFSADQIATNAQDNIAYRYALANLNPFAFVGDDGLYAQHNASGQLDLFNPDSGKGLSPEWIEDRSRMLSYVIQRNTLDKQGILVDTNTADNFNFVDATRGIAFKVDKTTNTPAADQRRDILFGRDQTAGTETFTGHAQADRLYGAAGADILKGNGGDDHLEGGTGNDQLRGGTGNDTYRIDKDSGVDTIIDYAGNGLLDFSHGAGAGDGQGSIIYKGQTLSRPFTRDATDRNLYHSADNDALLIRFSGTANDRGRLVITDPAGATLILQSWKSGELGLTLADSTDTRVFTDLNGTTEGDNSELAAAGHGATLTSTVANQKVYGLGGADLIVLASAGAIGYGGPGNDIITNGDGSQTLVGDDGNDILIASGGDDTLDGGIGDDALQGGADDDLLEGGDGMDLLDGGQGADVLKGGTGDDILFGGGNLTISVTRYESARDYQHFADGQLDMLRRDGAGNLVLPTLIGVSPTNADSLETALTHIQGDGDDLIDGGEGDDWVFAGDGADVVEGGAGKDVLIGDAGNDFMTGGSEDDMLYGDGAEGDLVAPAGGEGLVGWTLDAFHGDDYLDGGDGKDFISGDGGADELFGGAGDDRLVGDSDHVAVAFHGNDYLDGEAGNDSLWGYGGDDELVGGTGNDRLEGDSASVAYDKHGNDYLDGAEGNDTLLGDGGADTLFGGAGADELHGDAGDVPVAHQGADYLDGEEGNDYLSGYGGGDELLGGAGDDILQGGEGRDTLEGGSGIDLMEGGAGEDVYVFSTGDAPLMAGMAEGIVDTAGKDTLRFGAGIALANITASRANADDLLLDIGPSTGSGQAPDRLLIEHGLAGAVESFELGDGKKYSVSQFVGRTLTGQQVVNTAAPEAIVLGGTAADTLAATGGGATLSGGPGNDTLSATGDNNRIRYAKGDGNDRVATGGTGNVLGLGPGIAATDLKLKFGSLALQIGDDPNDIIHFDSFDPANALVSRPFDRIEFEPATDDPSTGPGQSAITMTYAELLALGFDIDGSAGNDTLTGTSVSDRIDGGAGDDSLTGGGGSDTYQWGTGGGRDTIENTDASVGTTDTLRIGGEADVITAGQLVFAHNGNDLIVRLRGATDQVTILNHYAGAAIDAIEFAPPSTGSGQAGEVWTAADIEAHVTNELSDNPDLYNGTAGNDAADGLGGNDTLNGLGGDDALSGGAGMDTLNGGTGHDTLDGGLGNDELRGEAGNDVYRFGRTSAYDFIYENDATAGNVDTVEFAADVAPDAVGVSRNINHLYLTIKGTTDKLTVVNHFLTDANRIEQVRFGSGAGATVWDAATLTAMCLVATEGADTLIGSDGIDVIDALGGGDTVDGQGGSDTLLGGAGSDSLTGGAGDDVLNGGADNDTLKGGSGDDSFDGGAGNDVLHGEAGNDTYRFGRGAGQDVIYDFDTAPGNLDTIEFAADVLPEHVTVARSVGELVLTIKGTTDKLRLLSYFSGDTYKIEQVRFGSGPTATVWDGAILLAQSLIATEGADTVTGGAEADAIDGLGGDDMIDGQGGNDTLTGGAGNDMLTGGLGGDTYRFDRGFGADTIVETGNLAGDIDTIEFAAGISPDDVVVNRVSAGGGYYGYPHLRLSIKQADGTAADSILVKNFFGSQDGANRIEQVRFVDSPTWDSAFLNATVASGTADADSMSGDGLVDNFYGLGGNDTLSGYGGNDILAGGAGDDLLYGGLGNDTYRFGRGDGEDKVSEVYQAGGTDTLELGPGIQQEHVSLYNYDGNLVVVIDGSPTQLTVSGFFLGGTAQIERILFADMSEWNLAAIIGRAISGTANSMTGGPGNDTFVVDHSADSINEGINQGTDTVQSRVGWTLGANLENLTLTGPLNVWATGNELNNVITGNTGNNVLDGRLGADSLIGGKGDDWYYVSDLHGDTVTELANEGNDTVVTDFSYTLPANVENLTQNSGYIGRVESLGNELDNLIIGRWGVSGDTLDGRGGNDTLKGGAGDDSYRFALGGGADNIVEVSGTDQIVFDTGISAAGVTAVRTGSQVKLAVSASDSISFAETAPGQYAVEKFVFKGGPTWTAADLRMLVNLAPTGRVGIGGTAAPGQTLTANNALADADGLGMADYQWQGSVDGEVTWSDIDGAIGESFTLTEAQVGLRLRVVASYTDGHGTTESIASDATAAIAGGNNAPTVAFAIADQVATADAAFAFTVPVGGFADIDVGDVLSYTATQGDGAALPAWLSFDAATRTFSGTPTSTSAGLWTVRVTASDLAGESASDDFALDVARHTVGTATANNLVGTALRDFIEGLAGNDTLNGGAGADTLSGGPGNDSYVFDNPGDVAIENPWEGVDAITSSSVSIILSANVENLTLTGSASIDGTGNDVDNALIGNAGNNTLLGGAGNDTLSGGGGGVDSLVGGLGNDTYTVYFRSTQVVENEGEGTDTVNCTMPYTLAAHVENLNLIGGAGNHIRGTGNAMDNLITGNAGNNTLDGKAGADTLIGALGNDTYLFGAGYGGDTIRENDATAGNTDAAQFLAGIAADQIWLRQAGNNLEASIIGTADTLTLENWYLGSSYHVEQFKTGDGRLLLDTRVENLVQAMAAFAPPGAGQTTLPPAYQEALAPVIAANWN